MRRIIAMLLAIVMLAGNVPVQAFATEADPQETLACVTEGCTYGAGHSGACSTFVACGKDGCTYQADHLGNCSTDMPPKVEAAADAAVYVTVSDRGELSMAYEEVTVSDCNQDGKLSVDEALYAAHTAYGKGYASENGTVTKLWDVETTNVSFFLNHEPLSTDVSVDTVSSGDYLVASVDRDTVNDYDKYSRFDAQEKSVSTGNEFILTLTDDAGNALAGMEIGLSNGDGSTTMLGRFTDENGQVSLSLDQEGLYCVTAKGTLVEQAYNLETNEFTSIETPIIAPVCVVTVSGNVEPEVSNAEPEACKTEGCTYGANHEGNCSNYVAPERIRSVRKTESDHSVTVGFTVVDCVNHKVECMRRELTVTPGLAKQYLDGEYGPSNQLTTIVGENDVTPIDVLVAAHLDAAYDPSENITGFDYATKMFGEQTDITWTANGNMPYTVGKDQNGEDCNYGYAINQYIVQDGDEICFYRIDYSAYPGSVYASFDQTEAEVETGAELTLQLGYCSTMEYHEDTFPAAGAQIYYLNEDGTLGNSPIGTTDSDGNVTVTFEKEGIYYLTCDGTVNYDTLYDPMEGKLSPAYVEITVTPAPCQHANTTTTHTPVAGKTQHTVAVTCNDCGEPTQTSVTEDCTDEDSNNTCDHCGAVLPVEVTSVTLNQTTLTMKMGDEPIQLAATVEPENATDKTVQWKTDNASVATADGGWVTAVGVGTATITATAGGKTATCQVTVEAAPVETGGITIATGHAAEYGTEAYLSQIVLNGVNGTATGSKYAWKVELAEKPEGAITLELSSSLGKFLLGNKANFYFFANDAQSAERLTTDPGTVTVEPEWIDGSATVTVGIKNAANKNKVLGNCSYTLELRANDSFVNTAPTLKDSSTTGANSSIYLGETYSLTLKDLFVDADGDDLTYTVQINEQASAAADSAYRFTPDKAGDYALVFRANDGKEDSKDCYTVNLTVLENTPPEINEDAGTEGTVSQYFTWSIDLSEVFTDKEHKKLTYSVRVNGGETKETGVVYSYIPETTGSHTLVFRAKDPSGAESKEFTVLLKVEAVAFIETTCAGTVAGDTWLGGVALKGAEVEKWKWSVEFGHDESENHVLSVELGENTADDAVISLAYQKEYQGLLEGSISGPDSVRLANGKGSVTVTVSNWQNSGTAKTYTLNFTNKPNTAPAASKIADTLDVEVPGDFTIDLTKIFTDDDGDTLRYTVKQGDSPEAPVEHGVFTRNIAITGQKLFVFTAYDTWNASATHMVFVTGKVPEGTYDVQLQIPEGITPSFYITGDFDGENGDTLGTALEAKAGETAGGFTSYTVKVPERVSRISFRGTDTENHNWGGMSVAVAPDMDPVTVIQLNAVIPSKADGSNVTAEQALFRLADQDGYYAVSGGTGTDHKGYVLYRFLTVAWGTEDLAKSYTAYAVPLGELAKTYMTATGEHTTFVKENAQQTLSLRLILKSSLTITAPTGAAVQVFLQSKYYNSQEVSVVEKTVSDDGTTTDWIFSKGDSSRMSYRVSMAGRITKAGYVNGDKINVFWEDSDPSPECQDPYDTSTTYGSRGDDSLMLNVNGRNHLVMQENGTFRLRAYRIWEIINSDTSNIIIHPDMNYTLSGDDILTVTPVTSGNGNGKNNWLDLTATGSGVAYLEVGYDALQILTGNMEDNDGGKVAGFTFNACDDYRTGLVVVQVGNAATDVSFGIRCGSTWDGKSVAWDAEFDTLYFTGDKGQLTLAPSVASGEIESVAVSADKGATWTTLAETAGVYVADIAPGNNILRVTKTDHTEAYQVVRGDKVTVTITDQYGKASDGTVEAGEAVRIQLHGLHNPIGKMSGNYNPGYGYGQHLKYTIDGISETKTGSYQYNFVSNAWMDIQIPKDAEPGTEYKLTNGHINLNVIGIHDITSDTENHRGINDDGCGTRGSGGTYHDRSILPEIVLKVKSSEVAVQKIELDTTSLTLKEDETSKLTATVTPDNATNKTVTWRSSNTAKVQVDNQGNVTALQATSAEETVTITAEAGGKTATCTVTVTPGLTFDIAEEDIVGYVTVSFEDQAQRVSSDLPTIDQKYQQPLGTIIEPTRVPFADYDTIATVTLRLLKAKGITPTHDGREDSGFYLRKIGNFTIGETTYDSFGEFDVGSGSGWMVTWTSQTGNKQDWFINQGAHAFYVNQGDEIKWKYTCQLGSDIGDSFSKKAVEAVIKLIDDIGEPASVTLESEAAIKEAREAYKELLPLLQGSVTNYDKLVAAENRLANLKASEEDKAAAGEVSDLIEKIPELKQENKNAIQTAVTAAREKYDDLTPARKPLVTNLEELEAAEAYLALLNRVPANIADIYTATGNHLAGKTLTLGSTNGEWAALGLARAGREVSAQYYTNVAARLQDMLQKQEIKNNRLHDDKSTENSRVILALTAIGKDVTNVSGLNLLAGLNDLTYIGKQGANGLIYALIALDSHDYTPVGITRDDLVAAILAKQLGDGGWSLGNTSDVDLTAMAIQALAPYCSDATVKAAVDKALTWLSNAQNQDGSFSTTKDGPNAESVAQVIVALTALDIDPDKEPDFIRNGISPVQALADFYADNGQFRHTKETGADPMATEQSYYALVAYDRFTHKKTSLYDMSDVKLDKEYAAEVDAMIADIGTVTQNSGNAIKEARDAYEALTDEQSALVTKLSVLERAKREYAQLVKDAADEAAADYVEGLIERIGTVDLTQESENKIKDARRAYDALYPTYRKSLVENYSKLLEAEAKLKELKDEASANEVEQKISNIGSNITLGSEAKINTARNAYDALTADQKTLVSNYQKLLNAEAALKALKATESVTFTLLGCYKHGTAETSVHTLAKGNLQTWISTRTVKIVPGDTVRDVFEEALKAAGLEWKNPTGNYVESIKYNGNWIGEFTNGSKSGWMYTLNGKHPNLGVNQQTLINGDKIVFHYTDDYTTEEGRNGIGTTSTTTGSTTSSTTSTIYSTYTGTASNTPAAEAVDRLIEDIGEEITLDSEAKILAARASYDKLTEAQKKLVKRYDALVAAEAKLAELKGTSYENVYVESGDYIQALGTPGVGAIGGEWMVIGLARSGREVPTGYYDHVLNYVRENINGEERLHSAKSSDNSRVIMALTAIGKDVTNVDGHDLLKGLNDMDYIQKQGINGPIWALLAFDSGNYPVPEGNVSRGALIDVILEAQLSDGGWALSGERSDPDMTGMALQALAPYMESNTAVKKAVEEAIRTLSGIQNDNGSFSSVDGPNSESIAQVIVALAALGIDADTDARFVKNGISAMDALLTYYIPGGGFRHILDGNLDGMSTEQAFYALVAYERMKQNQNFLYDMTDVVDAGGDVIVEETTEPTETPTEPAVEEEEDNGNNVVIWTGVMSICAAAIAVIVLNRKKLFGKF